MPFIQFAWKARRGWFCDKASGLSGTEGRKQKAVRRPQKTGPSCNHNLLWLPTAFCSSVFVLILVVVETGFLFDEINSNRVKTYYFQFNPTLFTCDRVALVRLGIDVDFTFAFRARSSRHLLYLQLMVFDYEARELGFTHLPFAKLLNPLINLTGRGVFLQSPFLV